MWVYWAISVPLTAIVVFIWRIWWNLEDRKYQEEVSKAKRNRKSGVQTAAASVFTSPPEEGEGEILIESLTLAGTGKDSKDAFS